MRGSCTCFSNTKDVYLEQIGTDFEVNVLACTSVSPHYADHVGTKRYLSHDFLSSWKFMLTMFLTRRKVKPSKSIPQIFKIQRTFLLLIHELKYLLVYVILEVVLCIANSPCRGEVYVKANEVTAKESSSACETKYRRTSRIMNRHIST